MDFKQQNLNDPIHRNAEKDVTADALSPMDPPDAYNPPGKVDVAVEDMHPFLQELVADHVKIKSALEDFETAVLSLKTKGLSKEANEKLRNFFEFFNDEFLSHDKREEKYLFPKLAEKLIEKGEHSQGFSPTTSVDVMEEDHLKAVQQTAVIFNFFGLASRLTDEVSRCIVMDAAIEQSNDLIELLRLHIFREDTIVFPLAQKYIDASDLDAMPLRGQEND